MFPFEIDRDERTRYVKLKLPSVGEGLSGKANGAERSHTISLRRGWLNSPVVVGSVVGFMCVGGQKSGRLVQWSILMLGEGQLDLGELAVRGLRRLVHARRHQGVLILLASHLTEGE